MCDEIDDSFLFLVKSDKKLAFQIIFDGYWTLLYKQALKKVQCKDAAKDLVQDSFLTLWDKIDSFDKEVSILAYLYGILRNKTLKLYEKNEVRARYAISVATKDAQLDIHSQDALLEKELSGIINNEIANMPPRMREIYLKKRDNDISIREIATDLSLSEQTIKNQLQTAYQRLRASVQNYASSPAR